jgi:erythromycin esterase-like protein
MGFDVLAFESEWYSLLKLDDSLASLSESAIKEGKNFESDLYQIWSLSRQVQPLFTYIRQSKVSTSPLTLAGFDCSHPQQIAQKQLIADLDTFLASLHYPTHQERHRQFNTILKGLMMWEYNNKSTQGEQALFFQELQSIKATIRGYRTGTILSGLADKLSFYHQVVTSLEGFAKHAWSVEFQDGRAQLMDKYGNKDGKVRDAYMASNALWLIKEKFKNRKLIFWEATYHFARNLSKTDSIKMGINYEKVRTLADILYEQIPGELYSIGFTAYQGEHGLPWLATKKLSLPAKGSMEELIHAANIGDCIIDFKNLQQGAWLQEDLSMRPLGYKAMTTQWPRVLDAIFFIDKMMPSTTKD